jgi:hypothetical protein
LSVLYLCNVAPGPHAQAWYLGDDGARADHVYTARARQYKEAFARFTQASSWV